MYTAKILLLVYQKKFAVDLICGHIIMFLWCKITFELQNKKIKLTVSQKQLYMVAVETLVFFCVYIMLYFSQAGNRDNMRLNTWEFILH